MPVGLSGAGLSSARRRCQILWLRSKMERATSSGARLIALVPSEFAPMTGWGDFRLFGSGCCHDTERDEAVVEETPATGAGWSLLAMVSAEVKEIPEFVVTPAKAIRRGGVTEPTHRTISALDPAVILFDSIVEILAGPVLYAVTQHCPDGPWVTVMAVSGDPRRDYAGDRSGGTEERHRRRHVTRLAEANVHQCSGTIDRPIQVAPTTMDLDVGLIEIPGAPDPPRPARRRRR